MKIGLVGCGKSKLSHPAPARDLYTGTLFKLSRAYAEQHCDAWVILSAEHGVLDPARVIEPYDTALCNTTKARRNAWGEWVGASLREHYPESATLVMLAGSAYEVFAPFVSMVIERPLGRLPIGKRMQWLKARVTL